MYAIISPTFVAFYRRLGPLKSVDRAHSSSYLRFIHEDQQRWLPGIQSKAKGYKYAKLRFLFFSCFLVMPCPLFPDLFWHFFLVISFGWCLTALATLRIGEHMIGRVMCPNLVRMYFSNNAFFHPLGFNSAGFLDHISMSSKNMIIFSVMCYEYL